MIPLATIGFVFGGILFFLYSHSLQRYASSHISFCYYRWAYRLLATTFILWGIAALCGNQHFLNISILIGNAFILIGSVLLLTVLTPRKSVMIFGTLVAVTLFIVRWLHFPPAPYMQEGILVFNTQVYVSAVYVVLFLIIWLPANLLVGKIVGSHGKVSGFTQLVQGLYGLSILAALCMPIARTPVVTAGAFMTLVLCYAVLIKVNTSLKNN